jgi:hypothetical protein
LKTFFFFVRRRCAALSTLSCFGMAFATSQPALAAEPPPDFGKDVQMAPFVVSGKKLSVAVHARTGSDRRYGEKFAEEVLEIAYYTAPQAGGKGLVIVGREGEPHPVEIMRKFLALAEGGQLGPELAAKAADISALMKELKGTLHLDDETVKASPPAPDVKAGKDGKAEVKFKPTFDLLMPALPLPLEGAMAKLYLLSWSEGFDAARVDHKLRSITAADLQGGELSRYDWVFYLPPRDAYVPIQNTLVKEAMKQKNMGLLKRAAFRSALAMFKPAIKKAVEAMRRGMLYMTVLRAESGFSREDIKDLTGAYVKVLLPDFKYTAGSERDRAFAAIDAQKLANEDYAKNPFIAPPRLTDFDITAYTPFEGDYAAPKAKSTWHFGHNGADYIWQVNQRPPLVMYPAGERLFVSKDAKMTLEFKTDEKGVVTGVEERRTRFRRTIPRKLPDR